MKYKLSNEDVRLIKTILVIVGIIIIATAVLFLVNENVQRNNAPALGACGGLLAPNLNRKIEL